MTETGPISDISELFARNPTRIKADELERIVQYYRERRATFNAGAMTAGKPQSKKSEKQKTAEALEQKLGKKLSLKELGLG